MRSCSFLAVLLVLGLPAPARSQDPRDLPVRTFKLQNLSAADAAKLLAPYVNAPNGGVFEAGSLNAITVRETHSMLAVYHVLSGRPLSWSTACSERTTGPGPS